MQLGRLAMAESTKVATTKREVEMSFIEMIVVRVALE